MTRSGTAIGGLQGELANEQGHEYEWDTEQGHDSEHACLDTPGAAKQSAAQSTRSRFAEEARFDSKPCSMPEVCCSLRRRARSHEK